ncbi:cobalamin biosynthesis protein D related protein [Thermoplasma acidophilum]|uniref:Cobalt-precorrin-5B C(1)-methyltransferase n=1 Tax=Thermoplasma acidophilum (strain ATCC 25905 / DSM 1728 / JCM 9062 / NBRC 15155 / AMRC-C165) TaxID=273075 RepID=CBID_THEAC|nr:cobalt-precorrin-5B (C(1))-methyltransferase CbiD [Thermoplasma acidophilum]Q9HKE5.1 RecName: Full=Cobalt-precorrin-5B C(1)-methyltransferase; AltName: Full=Cobalt-precorrin-6A synthase [Thermoplasma acidophilum DSM 1728]CAC11794.1 cobalamin biosynthesis protein D related protein [Thermoplasma acidophilum]
MTQSNPFQQYGITSGLAAAAAAKASVLAAMGTISDYVGVPTPIGLRIEVKVEMMKQIDARSGIAAVRKFSGDNPDTLNGALFESRAVIRDDGLINIFAGEGIGVAVSDGLPVRRGDPAINPVARMMIENAVREVSGSAGFDVYISVPGGEDLARDTMNPRVGISGGISILGTTGIEEPVSGPDYEAHIEYLLQTGRCVSTVAVMCPGNTAMRFAESYLRLHPASFILTGDRIGSAIEMAIEKGYREIVVFGLPGKLVKMAAGVMNTHSRIADARFETIAAYAALNGADRDTISKILSSNTVESAFAVLRSIGLLDSVAGAIASRIVERLRSPVWQIRRILLRHDRFRRQAIRVSPVAGHIETGE